MGVRHFPLLAGGGLAILAVLLLVPAAPPPTPALRAGAPIGAHAAFAPPTTVVPALPGPLDKNRSDPGYLNVTGADPTAISLLWTDHDDLSNRTTLLQLSTNGTDGPWTTVENLTAGSPETLGATNLTPGATYTYRVLESEAHHDLEVSPTLVSTQPAAPTLAYRSLGNGSALLNWTNPARYGGQIAFDNYTVNDALAGSGWSDLGTIGNVSTTSFVVASAAGDPDFRVTIRDTCCGGALVMTSSNSVNSSVNTGVYLHASVRPEYVDVGQTVTFTCVGMGGDPPYDYLWMFGDGNAIGAANVSHIYGGPGDFTTNCTVSDVGGGQVTSRPFVVHVTPLPTVVASVDHSVADPATPLHFTANVTGGRTPLWRINWTFGDGTFADGYNATHAYANPGSFDVLLDVVDGNGAVATSRLTITVAALGVNATESTRATPVGKVVVFLGDAVGGAGPPYSYRWNFGDGQTAGGNGTNHSYTAAGNFTATLTVFDLLNVSAVYTLPRIEVGAPLVAVMGFSNPSPTVGEAVTLTGQITGGSGNYTCRWSFGDTRSATGCTAVHAWAASGAYTVSLTVTDPAGGKSVTKTVLQVGASTGTSPSPNQTAPQSWIAQHWIWIVGGVVLVAALLAAWAILRRGDGGTDGKCATCGSRVAAGATSCPNCGASLGR